MNRLLKQTMLLFTLLFIIQPVKTYASEEPVRVFINGFQVLFTQLPEVQDGNTLVQLRPIFEGLGLKVDWHEQNQTIVGSDSSRKIVLKIDDLKAAVNEKEVTLSVAPQLIQGSAFVPLRFLGESCGGDVKWDEKTNHVDIITDKSYYVYLAVIDNDTDEVKHWISKGGRGDFANQYDGVSSIDMALYHRNFEVALLLLKNGADVNHVFGKPASGLTLLDSAIYGKDPEMVQFLLENGADTTKINKEGNSYLNVAQKLYKNASVPEDKENLKKIIELLKVNELNKSS